MNYKEDLGPPLTIFIAFALTITTIAVLLRCYVRIFLQRRFSIDDYLIVFSQANFCGFMFCVLHEVKYGLGKHLVVVLANTPTHLPMAMKYYWIAQVLFIFATCTVKISVAIFFCSLCPPPRLRLVAIVLACVSIATGLGTLAFQVFGCMPTSYFWERLDPTAQGICLNVDGGYAILQTVNTFDIATDFGLALLPCIMVWNMTMRRMKKVGVSILLGMGGLSAIAAIIRAFYFRDIFRNAGDFTYTAWPVTMTSAAEPAVAISVVCFAHLRPLMRQLFPNGWFTITNKKVSSDIITIGRIGRRPTPGISEISLDARLRPETYHQPLPPFATISDQSHTTNGLKDLEKGLHVRSMP